MVAKRQGDREPQRDITEPIRSPEPPQSAEDAAQVVRDVFGDGIEWERSFRHHQDAEGKTIYVDERTGQVYDELPRLAKDGHDA